MMKMNNPLFVLIGFLLAISADWAFSYFGLSCFEHITFHLKVPLKGSDLSFIKDWITKCFLKGSFLTICVMIVECILGSYLYCYLCNALFIGCIIYAAFRIGLIEFILNQFRKTDLYEKYYVDGKKVNISFPNKKKEISY